jgi:hypothetical protein
MAAALTPSTLNRTGAHAALVACGVAAGEMARLRDLLLFEENGYVIVRPCSLNASVLGRALEATMQFAGGLHSPHKSRLSPDQYVQIYVKTTPLLREIHPGPVSRELM